MSLLFLWNIFLLHFELICRPKLKYNIYIYNKWLIKVFSKIFQFTLSSQLFSVIPIQNTLYETWYWYYLKIRRNIWLWFSSFPKLTIKFGSFVRHLFNRTPNDITMEPLRLHQRVISRRLQWLAIQITDKKWPQKSSIFTSRIVALDLVLNEQLVDFIYFLNLWRESWMWNVVLSSWFVSPE